MRVARTAAVLTAAVLLLSGCGSRNSRRTEPTHASLEEILPKKEEPAEGTQKVSFGDITAELPAGWRYFKRDSTGAYIDDETKCAYMLSYEGSDRELAEEEVLDQYIAGYADSIEYAEQLSDVLKNKAGMTYRTAALRLKDAENPSMLMFVFWHSENRYAIFKGESASGSSEDLLPELKTIAASASIPEMPKKEPDLLLGHKYTVTAVDSFTLDLTKRGEFVIEQGDWKGLGYRIEGKSKVLRGKEALEEMKKYTGKFETLDIYEEWTKADESGSLMNYYAVILECETVLRWGAVVNYKSYTRLMTGVQSGPDTLSMYDHKEYIKQTWKIKE